MKIFLVIEAVDGPNTPGMWAFKTNRRAKAKVKALIKENREQGHDISDEGISKYVVVYGPTGIELED